MTRLTHTDFRVATSDGVLRAHRSACVRFTGVVLLARQPVPTLVAGNGLQPTLVVE